MPGLTDKLEKVIDSVITLIEEQEETQVFIEDVKQAKREPVNISADMTPQSAP